MTNQQEPKEHQLLRECIAGDRKAQQGLYDLFAPTVYAICLRYMGNSDDAKDMLQDTMVKFYQKAAVFNLFAIEGFSHAEIAELLGISENTSKSQLFKARKWLQAKLERN
ncbi:MAG: hypothetical protein EBQ97_02345 [Bacteroidetes bacterium]|nr:hypothetical protein [Bacteroidota bacterium]